MKNPIAKLFTVTALLGAPGAAMANVRTLASGAPACGNVMGKGDGWKDRACTTAELRQWRAEEKERAIVAKQDAAREAAKAARASVAPAANRASTPAKPAAARTPAKATR